MAIVTNDWTGKITGSVFQVGNGDPIVPPTGHVFVAITALTDTDFEVSGGLVADDATVWANTQDAANDQDADSETTSEGSGGVQINNTNLDLKSGITIYGRYTKIDIKTGQIIAYIGKA
jgi:hypothetical protein